MGGSRSGNFGKTNGSRSFLDRLSDILTAASLIPGLDTIADLAAIPVDLLRGDLESALLDFLGVLPLAGEIADTAKIANKVDDAVDTTKLVQALKNALDTKKLAETATANKHITKREKLLTSATNQKLKNTINEMYRATSTVGDGGLGDAIRHELKTGELVGGKSHIQKGKERLKNLENILKKQELNTIDQKIINDLITDLKNALEDIT